jgi:negative regulator of flagellin synthesis FlgM
MRPIEIRSVQSPRAADPSPAPAARARPASRPAGEVAVEVVRSSLFAAQQPPVDAERVEALRQAIASGTYALSPADIATAMIELAGEWENRP